MLVLLKFLGIIKDLLGGWRGVVLASLLLCALAWGGCSHLNGKRLERKVDELTASTAELRGHVAAQNEAVEKWEKKAAEEQKNADDAQAKQLALADKFRRDLLDQAKRLKFTGDCSKDVEIASEEFRRQAGGR